MQQLCTNSDGQLLVSKQVLLTNGVVTDTSYRTLKSRGKLKDIQDENGKWVLLNSLTAVTREKVVKVFSDIQNEYTQLLRSMSSNGEECTAVAVGFTADSLQINEPFIRSSIETYTNTHYTIYVDHYMSLGLHSQSVKGYAKQCALCRWMYDFVLKIEESEADKKRCEVLLRSFKMNLLTSIELIEFERKIPVSMMRFTKWFDEIIAQMRTGKAPEELIEVKRLKNNNAGKVTHEQLNIVLYWHINGTNMSIAALYKKWIAYAKENGWWIDKEGKFAPPTEARLYQLLAPYKNPNTLAKTDAVEFRANIIPHVSRDLPTMRNQVWVIDGTAHNENVESSGSVKQHIYTIKVADVATLKTVGVSCVLGVKEPFVAVKEAILMGIRETGCKPAIIHCDKGPAYNELKAWCEANDIKLYASITGNARAKTIENMFSQFDNDVTRYLNGYSGQNRTATSVRSRSSDKRETAGKRNARSASIVMEWLKREGVKLWNERKIEQLEGKPCNKTPNQLWEEKESFVPELSYNQLCVLCGTLHERKLTINGLEIGHKNQSYVYYPDIKTPEERKEATRIFTEIPMDANTINKLKIYILEGGEPAAVYTHDDRYLGVWGLKQRVAFIADTKEEKEELGKFLALQERMMQRAKEVNADIKQNIERHPDYERIEELGNELLTGKHCPTEEEPKKKKWSGRYDKSNLLTEEREAKAGEASAEPTPLPKEKRYKELVDCDTGEIIRIEIKD